MDNYCHVIDRAIDAAVRDYEEKTGVRAEALYLGAKQMHSIPVLSQRSYVGDPFYYTGLRVFEVLEPDHLRVA